MNQSDLSRNAYILSGNLAKNGFMRWWSSFCGIQPQTKERRTFFIEYLIMNPSLGQDIPIIGETLAYRKNYLKPSYFCVKAGVFSGSDGYSNSNYINNSENCIGKQLFCFYSANELKIALEPLILQSDNQFYSENHIYGSIEVLPNNNYYKLYGGDTGCIKWDLEVYKSIACHTGKLSYTKNTQNTFWHGEGIKTQYRGTVILDNILYEITPEDSYGYSDKHWGQALQKPWIQFASCRLYSKNRDKELRNSALAVNSYTPKFSGILLKPQLFLQLTYEGQDFECDYCKWKTKFTNKRIIWKIIAQNQTTILKLTGFCFRENILEMNYETPAGSMPETPIFAGCFGIGTILLYQKEEEKKVLLDTLKISDAFCVYGM